MILGEPVDFSEFAAGHGRFARLKPGLTDAQEQYILAAIAGDGYVGMGNKNSSCPRIAWNMGNKDHALSKLGHFEFLGATYSEKDNPGFGEHWYCVVTKSHPILNKYIGMSAAQAVRQLNSTGWAIYYGDDGHYSKSQDLAYIHTEGESYRDVESITECLNKFLGFDGARIYSYIGGTKKRKMHAIRMTKRGTYEFFKKTSAHMERGVEYKNTHCDKC